MVEVEGIEPSYLQRPHVVFVAVYPVTPVMDILVILFCLRSLDRFNPYAPAQADWQGRVFFMSMGLEAEVVVF